MVMERDLTRGGEHTIQRTDDILQNCAPETCIILLISVTPINPIKILEKEKEKKKHMNKSIRIQLGINELDDFI